jgi:3-hydroxybutyrate dehydrogenase
MGALAVFFCFPAGNNVRGVAWNMYGGWVAQLELIVRFAI